MIINRANVAMLFTAWNGLFSGGLKQKPEVANEWKKFSSVAKSTGSVNLYTWFDAFPRIREWLGDRHIKDLTRNAYQLANKTHEASVSVPINDIEDDQVQNAELQFAGLGARAAQFPNESMYATVKAALTALCYDGRPFFDTAHPMVNSAGTTVTFSNLQAGAGAPWYLMCTNEVVKPFVFQDRQAAQLTMMGDMNDEAVFMRDEIRAGIKIRAAAGYTLPQLAYCSRQPLTQANFDAAYQAIQQMTDSEGVPLGFRPDLLLVGASNRSAARQVVKANLVPWATSVTGSGTNTVGGNDNTNKDIVDLIDTSYLP